MITNTFNIFYNDTVKILSNPQNQFYIWGAGIMGEYVFHHLKEKSFPIQGFIDTNPDKQKKLFCGFSVLDPDAITWTDSTKIILASLDYPDGIEQYLQSLGKKENLDYFFSNTFLSVYMMNRHQQLYLHHINVNITDRCTLRCRDCSLLIPYYTSRNEYPLEKVLDGLKKLFEVTDYVQEIHLIGGEPLLYSELPELISEIGNKYRHKIGELAIATNGTILPSKELCQTAKAYNVFFTISDYTSSPAFPIKVDIPTLLQYLEMNEVVYRIGNKAVWFDFNNTEKDSFSESSEVYTEKFQKCFFRNRGLYLDKLYYCQHQYGVMRAELLSDDSDAYLELSNSSTADKMHLLQFELGFVPRGFLLQCQQCNGFERLNHHFVDAAVQLDSKNCK